MVADTAAALKGRSETESYLENQLQRTSKLHTKSVIIAPVSSLIGAASLAVYCHLIGLNSPYILFYAVSGWVVGAATTYLLLTVIIRNLLPELDQLIRYNLYERRMLQALLDDDFHASMMMKRFPGLYKNVAIHTKSLNVRSFKQQIHLFYETMYIHLCVYFRCRYLPISYHMISRSSYLITLLVIPANAFNNLLRWFPPPVFGCLALAIAAYSIPYCIIITACVRYCLVDALFEAYFGELPVD